MALFDEKNNYGEKIVSDAALRQVTRDVHRALQSIPTCSDLELQAFDLLREIDCSDCVTPRQDKA